MYTRIRSPLPSPRTGAAVAGHDQVARHHIELAAGVALSDIAWLDRCPALRSLRDAGVVSAIRPAVETRGAALRT
jgi:hypothetical protein